MEPAILAELRNLRVIGSRFQGQRRPGLQDAPEDRLGRIPGKRRERLLLSSPQAEADEIGV